MNLAASPTSILDWQRNINGHSALSSAAKTIAVEISLHINSASATAWPSIQRLARRTNLAISTTKRAVRQLVQLGLIAVQRTGRSNRYRLIGLTSETSDSSPVTPKRTKERTNFPLETSASASSPQTDVEAKQERERVEDHQEPETPPQAAQEPTDPEEIAALIAYFWSISGTKPEAARHYKALKLALRTNTADEIKQAAKAAKQLWSNAAFITPAAICKEGRIQELLSQATAAQGAKAACHAPFKIDRDEYRAPSPQERQEARSHLAALKQALGSKQQSGSALASANQGSVTV